MRIRLTVLTGMCGFLAGLAAGPAGATTLVRWYDDYHKTPDPGRYYSLPLRGTMGEVVSHGIDVDNDGELNDSVVWWPFSMDRVLTPVTDKPYSTYLKDKPSANFFGGVAGYYADFTTERITQPYVMFGMGANPDPNQPDDTLWKRSIWTNPPNPDAYSDMAIFFTYGSAWTNVKSAFHSVFMWKKDGFLGGYNDPLQPIAFTTPGSTLSVAQTRMWNGVEEGRFVVQDGDQFYISEFSFGGPGTWGWHNALYHSIDPTLTRWAVYDVADEFRNGIYGVDFDEQNAAFVPHTFLDVQSVGVYLEKDVLTPDTTVFVFDDFRLSYVVPEPMSCLMGLAGAFLVVQRRRLRRG